MVMGTIALLECPADNSGRKHNTDAHSGGCPANKISHYSLKSFVIFSAMGL